MKRKVLYRLLTFITIMATLTACGKKNDKIVQNTETPVNSGGEASSLTDMDVDNKTGSAVDASSVEDNNIDSTVNIDKLQEKFAKDVRDGKACSAVQTAIARKQNELVASGKPYSEIQEEYNALTDQFFLNEIAYAYRLPLENLSMDQFVDDETGAFYNPMAEDGTFGTGMFIIPDEEENESVDDYSYDPDFFFLTYEEFEALMKWKHDDWKGDVYQFLGDNPYIKRVVWKPLISGEEFTLLADEITPGDEGSPFFYLNGKKCVFWDLDRSTTGDNYIVINGVKVKTIGKYDIYDDTDSITSLERLQEEQIEILEIDELRMHQYRGFPYDTEPVSTYHYVTVNCAVSDGQHYINRVYESRIKKLHEEGYSWEELTYQNYQTAMLESIMKQCEEAVKKLKEGFSQNVRNNQLPPFSDDGQTDNNADRQVEADNNENNADASVTETSQETKQEGNNSGYTMPEGYYYQELVGDTIPINGAVPTSVMTFQDNNGISVTLYDANHQIVASYMGTSMDHVKYKYAYLTDLYVNGVGGCVFFVAGTDSPVSGNLNHSNTGEVETDKGMTTGTAYGNDGY
ncbi:hypothetical protein SAMN04487928_1276 [Butyrivibrio proteoclasticus]|uniref:Uncharacterized protein n=1 Tax=Butyrivibrio proteoclasticus TaxID=43305 RepID=A0A1I5X073_9FIRM|nr:hypothetical protein [Butyrivibrio proteoclasticus]SFQ25314.1 hypothetical protein SAMN04487928_1276 [Butyrivibrio proteoclasticus]